MITISYIPGGFLLLRDGVPFFKQPYDPDTGAPFADADAITAAEKLVLDMQEGVA